MGLLSTVLVCSAAHGDTDSEPIAWPDGETDVVLRYEISGQRAARAGTQVALRTVYGDGFTVWVDGDAEPTSGCAHAILTGRVDAAAIRHLLTAALDSGFFELAADQRPPAPPQQGDADPLPLPLDVEAETLTVALAHRTHRVSVRPAGWPEAPAAFRNLRDTLLALSPVEPRPFVPTGYRLRVKPLSEEDPSSLPQLPTSLVDLTLDAAVSSRELEPSTGEALDAWLAEHGTRVLQGGRVFYLELLAKPPR